jgi:hypothetical protein
MCGFVRADLCSFKSSHHMGPVQEMARFFFCVFAVGCLSLTTPQITHLCAQMVTPVLHIPSGQPLAVVQNASPGIKIIQMFSSSTAVNMWSVETPLTLNLGDTGCPFSLPVPRMPVESVVLATHRGDDVVTSFAIDSFGNMAATSALTAATKIGNQLKSAGWQPASNLVQHTPAQTQRLLQRDFGVAIANLHCGHSQIFISLSRDPRHPKVVTYSFIYNP